MLENTAARDAATMRHQKELAEVLVGCFGYHGAIDECLRNGLDGVLAVLLDRKDAA